MAKKELTEKEIAECIPDLWMPLTTEQREFLVQNFTIQKFKKNETIYCEGETPMHLMCLLNGKVKIYKEGVGGRSQIIRVIKDKEYSLLDMGIAVEHFCLQAAELGLGTCIMGWFDEKKVKKLLGIKNKRVPLLITLGYPAGETRRKIRKSLDDMSSWNKY